MPSVPETADPLADWTHEPYSHDGITHEVYRRGSGFGVVLTGSGPARHARGRPAGDPARPRGRNPEGVGRLADNVLTWSDVEQPGHPTNKARAEVVAFLRERLTG